MIRPSLWGRALVCALLAASAVSAATPSQPESRSGGEGETEGGEADDSAPPGHYDPFLGIDRNGRIPKVPMPDDIGHPSRWRYIPEGRIKPGNVFQRLLVSSFVVPFVFRNGDVGTGLGLALTDIDFRLRRRREFLGVFGSYTTKGQQHYALSWRRWLRVRDLPDGGVIQHERSFVRARVGYRKTLTRRFFGFGPDRKASDESSYTDEAVAFALGGSYSMPKPVENLVIEFGGGGAFHSLSDGRVGGRPSMRDAYPEAFQAAEKWNLGRLDLELRWDTRDSIRNPYRGFDIGAKVDFFPLQTGWDTGAVFKIFGTKIFTVPGLFHDGGDDDEAHPPTDALAFGLFTQITAGDLPFFLLPTLGGTWTHRGYIDGRWRDRASWHGSAEYRFWLIPRGIPVTRTIRLERVGLAGFYEVGAVAGSGSDLFRARVAHTYGFGVRISLERSALFRFDVGFSEDGQNFAAGFGVTF